MDRKWLAALFLLVFILALLACGRKPGGSPAASSAALPNLLVQADGAVWLRRAGWSGFQPAGFGVQVEPGDMLRVTQGGSAAIFCGPQSQWAENPRPLPADGAEHGVPCQAGRPPRPMADVAALRGEKEGDIPYVLSPRDSALLTDRPSLRWFALPGVDSYSVSVVSDDGKTRPAAPAGGGELAWPASWPPLEPGATYVLVVSGGGRSSDEGNREHAGLAFWLLDAREAEQVRAQEGELRGRPLSPAALDLLLAELYRGHGLRAEAAWLLEQTTTREPATVPWLNRGQLCLETGLPAQAEEAFQQALESARAAGDLEMQAQALVGWGLARRLLGDEAAARSHLQAAQALYEQLGDQSGIGQVDRLLKP